MMNPVFRVLMQRAQSGRHSLLGLAAILPDEFLARSSPGEEWCVRDHLVHALGTDGPTAALLRTIAAGANALELSAIMTDTAARRLTALSERAHLKLDQLVEIAHAERQELHESAAHLAPDDLETVIPIPGARNAWGDPLGITVFHYLEQWANHDAMHEEAIRAAIATRPDLSTVALTRRLR